ncbi:MAG: hypothetical protein ACJ8FY_00315 [Gemmataceae bacterium]
MSANSPAPPAPDLWQANSLRVTAFPTVQHVTTPQNWWRDLVGIEPETSTQKRHERENVGIYNGCSLTLTVDLVRIQWMLTPRMGDPSTVPDQPVVLGQFLERQLEFITAINRWLGTCPPIKRLAFGSLLLQPVLDHAEGYRLLDRYLRCVDVDPESSDFMYRLNRRRRSEIGIFGPPVNRLSTWAVARISTVAIGAVPGGTHMVQGETFACSLELDISTPAEFDGELPHDELPRVLTELAEFGVDIATDGDRRA